MFSNNLQIMLYVNNVSQVKEFWTELGFFVVSEQELDGTEIVEIAPSKESEIHFVLYDREFIENYSPEVATNAPSIMFQSDCIEELYKKILTLDVSVGDLIQMDNRLVFNFSDPDGNYFAVSSKD